MPGTSDQANRVVNFEPRGWNKEPKIVLLLKKGIYRVFLLYKSFRIDWKCTARSFFFLLFLIDYIQSCKRVLAIVDICFKIDPFFKVFLIFFIHHFDNLENFPFFLINVFVIRIIILFCLESLFTILQS